MTDLQRKNPFSHEELSQLRDDMSEQLAYGGPATAEGMIPKKQIRQRLGEITHGNTGQTNAGLLGGAGGAILGGGLGALTTGLMHGKGHSMKGLLGAIPGSILGYGAGKELMQRKQLMNVLKSELGENPMLQKQGKARWRKEMEPGFLTVYDELKSEKNKGIQKAEFKSDIGRRLTSNDVNAALKDLKSARGRGLSVEEERLLRKELGPRLYKTPTSKFRQFERRVQKLQAPQPPKQQASRFPWGGDGGAGRSPSPKPKVSLKDVIRKNPKTFGTIGGLAVLSALGLLGSKYLTKDRSKRLRGRNS